MARNFQTKLSVGYSNKGALLDGENSLPRYNKSIVNEFANFFGLSKLEENSAQEAQKVLDFGAGTGSLAEIFRGDYGINPICIEIDPELRDILKEKNFNSFADVKRIKNDCKFIYSSNVLEHIDNDVEAITMLRKLIPKGGQIGIYVPALPFLFSDLDRKAGHFRRYKKSELIEKFQECGFKIDRCFYNDFLGVPASLVLKFFGYRNKSGLGAKGSLIIYDRYLYPFSQFLDKLGFRYICGKNIFLLAHSDELYI
jgi:SAM-dependent methyltransferase